MNYWIMKSEPDVFSIDDLMARKNQTEPWNGVRNYQARNFMKTMELGDEVLFYHSSCEIPGIVGVMKVTKSAYSDQTALDPKSDFFDKRHTIDKPIWFQVDVKFVKKFKKIFALSELKDVKGLEDLLILRKGNRLSVTPLHKKEFDIILKLGCNDH